MEMGASAQFADSESSEEEEDKGEEIDEKRKAEFEKNACKVWRFFDVALLKIV